MMPLPERDAPPRSLRERFLDMIFEQTEDDREAPGALAWQLILDAWRVIEVASARADRPATPTRDEWDAALRVAIFRAEHPEAPELEA